MPLLSLVRAPLPLLRSFAADRQLRNADFRRFWFSSTLTNFGAQITLLALPICAALLLHATPAQMGTLAAVGSLPFLLFSLPTGVLLDRSRRLPVMLASDAMVALSLASVPFAWWQGWLSVHWLYAVQFMLGTGFVVGGSAEQIFLTFLVGRDGLIDAQSKLGATESASRLLGPGISCLGFMLMPTIPRDLLGSRAATAAAYAGVVFCLDCGGTLFFLPYLALRQRVTPDPLLGRMTSTMRFMTVVVAPIGAAGAGALAERLGVRGGLTVVAAGALLLTLTTLFGTRLHQIRH